jgi:hypothetical protein
METMLVFFTSRQGPEMNYVSQYEDVCFLHEIHQVNNTRLGFVGCQQPDRGLSAARETGKSHIISEFTFHIAP